MTEAGRPAESPWRNRPGGNRNRLRHPHLNRVDRNRSWRWRMLDRQEPPQTMWWRPVEQEPTGRWRVNGTERAAEQRDRDARG